MIILFFKKVAFLHSYILMNNTHQHEKEKKVITKTSTIMNISEEFIFSNKIDRVRLQNLFNQNLSFKNYHYPQYNLKCV